MSLQSNIFNITKVRNGVDANNAAVVRTNVETIYKFPEDYKEGEVVINETDQNSVVYTMSPEELVINLGSLKKEIDQTGTEFTKTEYILRDEYNVFIYFNGIELRDFLEPSAQVEIFDTYVTEGSDSFSYKLLIQELYNDYLNWRIKTELEDGDITINNREVLQSFFQATEPTSIEVQAIYGDQVVSKFLNLQIGSNLDIATMSINAAKGIFMAMQNAGLKFDSSGLKLLNGSFEITNSSGKSVLYFDKENQNLSVTGNVNATSGTFSGELVAAYGTFTGEMWAKTGRIGGFRITNDSIVSDSGKLELFSQSSLEVGEIEQGLISSTTHANGDSNYRVRTEDYIKVEPEVTYLFDSNVEYIMIQNFSAQDAEHYVSKTDWVSGSNYSYTIPSEAEYIRVVFAHKTSTSTTEAQKITPEEVTYFAIFDKDRSLINVENINIGDGGVVDGYLRVGNLSLINPAKEDNVVLKLEVPGEIPYFKLTNQGYIEGQNWSIKKESGNDYVVARFGKLIAEDGEFNGIIRARDGIFTGEVLSSVITASTINTANFVTENTRSLGGSFVFKPTFEITDIAEGTKKDNKIQFELENSDGKVDRYFSNLGITDLTHALESGGLLAQNGAPWESDFRIRTANYIKVNTGEKLYCTINIASGIVSWITAWTYDQNKKYLGQQGIWGNGNIYTVSDTVKYIKIVIANDNYTEATGLTESTFNNNKTKYYTKNSSNKYIQCTASSVFSSSETYYTHNTISTEDVTGFYLNNVNDKIVGISGQDVKFGKFSSINGNLVTVEFKDTDYDIFKLDEYQPDDFEQGAIDNGVEIESTSTIRSKNYREVNPGDKLYRSTILSNSAITLYWSRIYYFDQDFNYLANSSSSTVGFVAPERAKYIRAVIANTAEGGTLEPSDLDTYYFLNRTEKIKKYNTLTLIGSGCHDTLIGINSDDTSAGNILPARALTMETFTDLQETPSNTGRINYRLNLLLGDLSTLAKTEGTKFNYVDGYGLYADNVFLHGSLMTNATDSYAGIHTSKDLNFSYDTWTNEAEPGDGNYIDEKIIFWGGANSLSDDDIQKSPFIVTDKGSIFASRGEFKGAILSDSLVVNTIIKAPMIYGTGQQPSLKIYNIGSAEPGTSSGYSGQNGYGGIGFYKQMGYIDPGGSTPDLQYLNLNEKNFVYYIGGKADSIKIDNFDQTKIKNFITFKNTGVDFDGFQYTAGTTTLSSRLIQDQTGGNTAATIILSGEGSSSGNTTDGEIELSYGEHGIQIDKDKVWNFGGVVQNDGEVIFHTDSKELDYKLKNGYYCLFVR